MGGRASNISQLRGQPFARCETHNIIHPQRRRDHIWVLERAIPGSSRHPRSIFISCWVLLALAQMGESGTREELKFLIDEQRQDGWWSVFPVEHESQYASSYGTAWALLGLNAQLTKGFLDAKEENLVSVAIQKGSSWLLAQREQGSRTNNDYLSHRR
jgi:hypothetical protein